MKSSSTSESGFISLGLIRLIIPIALLWGGGQGLYTSLTNREPHSITFAEYTRTRPEKKWVELKDTQLDLLGAISSGMLGNVSEIYIPMRAPGAPEESKVMALLLTQDVQTMDLIKRLRALKGEKEIMEFIVKNRDQVFPRRTVRGLVQFGIDSESKKRRKIAKLDAHLAEDFAVIEEGKKPETMLSLILFVLAFPAVWLCWFRSSKPAEGIPSGSDSAPPPLPK